MAICRIVLVASLLACLSYCVLAADPAAGLKGSGLTAAAAATATSPATGPARQLITMRYATGAGSAYRAFVLRSFELNDDGGFVWAKGSKDKSAPQTLAGKLSGEQVKALTEKIQAAQELACPREVDYVGFEFVNAAGRLERKPYPNAGEGPAASLLAMIDELAQKNATPQASKRLVSVTYVTGWNRELLRSFSLNEDGSFTWVTSGRLAPQTLVGKLGEEDAKSLIEKIRSAAQRPAAVGAVHFEFIDSDGKLEQKDYSADPSQPAAALVAAIDGLAQKNGKPEAATRPTTGASTSPTTSPAEISQDDALKIAEETLRKRGTDTSAMAYHGASLFTDRDGKKYWRVSWGPKQPPQVEGQPRAMIMGGQVNVLVSVDTGETKMLLGM